jgi:peptidoglycan/xylan/chitin deacetylase (PgdA/CDA1 family)
MYHNVVETAAERDAFHPAHSPYVLTRAEFAAHIDAALGLGWRFLAAGDLYGEAAREARALLLTFDDSWENHTAVEVMEGKGIRGIFFLNSGEIGWPDRLSKDAVARMAAAGHEIGSHSVKHEFLTRLGDDELRAKLAESKKVLEDISGRPLRFLSAPGGRYDARVARVAREVGYEAFFVSWPGFLGQVGNDFVMKRISIAARVDAAGLVEMLSRPLALVLRRKARYRLMRLLARFSRKHGGEGH